MAQYCVRCGVPLVSGERFCTNCGYPVSSTSSEGPGTVERKSKQRRRFPGDLVLGIALLAVALLIVGAGVFLFLNSGIDRTLALFASSSEDEPVVAAGEFGSLESVEVASSTSIVPVVAKEEATDPYRVRIKQAEDSFGVFIPVDDLPILSVTGSEGFSLADFGSLNEGTYYLSIRLASGDPLDLPPLVLTGAVSSEGLPEEVDVAMPADATSDSVLARRGKYEAYLDTLNALVGAHGEASLTVMKVEDERYLSWASGVSYAGLLDFGDGTERLVVMYCLDREFAESDIVEIEENASVDDFGPMAGDYRIEIYEYDLIADETIMICQTTPEDSRDGRATLRFVKDSDGHTLLGAAGESSGEVAYYGINEVGSFGELPERGGASGGVSEIERYCFFNVGRTQEESLEDAGSGEVSCKMTAQTVNDLIARFESLSSW